MDSFDGFINKESEVVSDMGDEDETMRDINIASTGNITEILVRKELIEQETGGDLNYSSESNANDGINPSKTVHKKSQFKKIRDKDDVKSVEPTIQFL